MIKTLRLMLFTLLTIIGSSVMAQTIVKWTADKTSGIISSVVADQNITLTWVEGGGDQAPKYVNQDEGSVYFYNGNRLTVSAGNDATITQIVFTFSKGSASLVLCDASGKNESSTGITNDYSGMTSTWTGEATSLTFRAAKQTNARYIKSIEVTYTGGSATPTEQKPVLAITNANIADSYDMDTNGVFVVYYQNTGNADAENAKLTLYVDGNENASKEIGTLNFGESNQNFWNAKYDLTNLEAGDHQVYVKMTADNADAVQTEAKTVTFTKKAPEAAFNIAADAVNVAYNAESYDVVATLTETNNVAATDVKVELRKGIVDVLATKTVETLAANGNTQVTLTVAKESFETGTKTYNLYVNDKFLSTVNVTFEEAPVVDVKDLAIVEVLGTIKLAEETNQVRVTVKNNGNVDITDAAVVLKAGDSTLGEGTVSAAAGQQGWTMITVSKEGLEAGNLDVTATVTIEGDATPTDNTLAATLTVEAIPAAEATFSVEAANVSVEFGVQNFTIEAIVKNTSDVDAENVEVKLFNNTVIDTKTIETLAAGAQTTVTFTIEATEEAPFEAGKTRTYYVQAPKTQATVIVTFEEEQVPDVIDVALTQFRGLTEINLKETNLIYVDYTNESNVDVTGTITLYMNEQLVEEAKAVTKNGFVSFTLPTEGLVAGEKATLVATLSVTGNKAGNKIMMSTELPIVSGDAAPAAEISINPVSSMEVEAGEQQVSVTVSVFNNGEVDAENVSVELYKSYHDGLCEAQTVNVSSEEGKNFQILTFTFNYTFEEGKDYEFTVFTNYKDADASNQMQKFTISCPTPIADVAVVRVADIEATTEEDVKISATLKNNSNIAAENVLVALYQGQEQVGDIKKVETIAAGEFTQVEFNLGKLAAATYNYNVMITSKDANDDNNVQSVTVKVSEPVVPVVEVALTAIQGISNINLAAEANNTISVWVANNGNVNVEEATVAVKLNDTELTAQKTAVEAGRNAYVTFELPTEGLVAGQKATVVATVTVAGNTSETTTLTREYDIVNSEVATEPVFAVSANAVEVEVGTEKFNVVATVKNTSAIDAANVEVSLFHNTVIATQTIESLAAGAEATVTFEDVENPFAKVGEYTMYVMAPNAQDEVKVVVKPVAVEEVKDLAIEAITGTIDLNYESSNVTVSVKNNGNVDVKGAKTTLTYGETTLESTVSVKAGETGYAFFQVATEGITGETLAVTANVELEGDATATDNTKSEDLTVKAVDAAVAKLSVNAEDITITLGDGATFKVTVQNISDVDAKDIEVKIVNGTETIVSKTVAEVKAGESTTVELTIPAIGVATILDHAGEVELMAIANTNADWFTLTVNEKVSEKIDLAVTAISGTLSLDTENNYLLVFVDNLGTVDVENAVVTLTAGDKVLGTAEISAKAGSENNHCTFAVAASDLTAGEFTVTATVTVEWDADKSNNTVSHTYTIAAPQAKLSITGYTEKATNGEYIVSVLLTNSSNVDAEDVTVQLYDGGYAIENCEKTVDVPANTTVTVQFIIAASYKGKQIQAYAPEAGSKWITVTDEIPSAINGIAAQNGKSAQIYTINGAKINSVKKAGLYIINGRKVMVK